MSWPDTLHVEVDTPVAVLAAQILAESGVQAVNGFAARLADEATIAAAQGSLPVDVWVHGEPDEVA